MAHFIVAFEGTGRFVERDAWWYRVSTYRDGEYLGCWNGSLSGLESMKLNGRVDPEEVEAASVIVTAERLRGLAESGDIRCQWDRDVEELVLSAAEVAGAAARAPRDLEATASVLEFDVPDEHPSQ